MARAQRGAGAGQAPARLARATSAGRWSCPRRAPDALLTKESLRQLESSAAYRLEQKRAAIAAAESRIQEAASKLALAQQQLARTEVRADVPGIVVYRDVFFGSEQRKPQVGDQVWANQPLLILPDISKMVVETQGARDGHPQGREEPERGRARRRPTRT